MTDDTQSDVISKLCPCYYLNSEKNNVSAELIDRTDKIPDKDKERNI